jgi:hypothetical protein
MNRFIVAIALAPGCFLLPGESHGLKGGETLYVAEDSQALEVMGPSMNKEDHRKHSRGKPLAVVAAGATVRVAKDYEQQRELNTNGAPLAHRNPWILVEVVASPVVAQRGWKGWIHLETTRKQPTQSKFSTTELPRASLLCPWADASELTCNVNLAAKTAVHVIGCSGPRVQVELFTDRGLYIHGFVNASQFPTAPCTTASKG